MCARSALAGKEGTCEFKEIPKKQKCQFLFLAELCEQFTGISSFLSYQTNSFMNLKKVSSLGVCSWDFYNLVRIFYLISFSTRKGWRRLTWNVKKNWHFRWIFAIFLIDSRSNNKLFKILWITIQFYWWLVRVTLVVAWWLFAPKFWEVVGVDLRILSLLRNECSFSSGDMWGGGDTQPLQDVKKNWTLGT